MAQTLDLTTKKAYQSKEVLNKVLNTAGDALNVDIDNVTLKTEGSDVAIEVHLDKAEDSVLLYANTAKDGSGTSYVPLVNSAGQLSVAYVVDIYNHMVLQTAALTKAIGGYGSIVQGVGEYNTKDVFAIQAQDAMDIVTMTAVAPCEITAVSLLEGEIVYGLWSSITIPSSVAAILYFAE